MNDIIDEIKSDLQEERISKIISRYGKHIVAVAFLILFSVGAFVYISNKKIDRQENLSKAYFAFQKSDKKSLPDTLKSSSHNIYTDLANIESANALRNSGNHKDALSRLLDVVKHTNHNEMKNLATIHAGLIILENNDRASKESFLSEVSSNANQDEPFADLMNWIIYQIKTSGTTSEKRQEILKILKSKETKSQNIKLMNDILINSIKNK